MEDGAILYAICIININARQKQKTCTLFYDLNIIKSHL